MKVLMVVASNNFREEEHLEPRHVLKSFGAKITVASSAGHESKGGGFGR